MCSNLTTFSGNSSETLLRNCGITTETISLVKSRVLRAGVFRIGLQMKAYIKFNTNLSHNTSVFNKCSDMFRHWLLAIIREFSLVCATYVTTYMSEIPRWLQLLWWLRFTILKISIMVKIYFKCSTKLFFCWYNCLLGVTSNNRLLWNMTSWSSGNGY